MGGHYTRSYMGRRQSSQSRWTGNPSEARRRRQLLATVTHNRYLHGRGARLGLGSRRTRYTIGGHTANTDTRVISGGRRGSVVYTRWRKYNQTVHTPRKKYVIVYMQIFMFVGVSVIEILLFNRKKKKQKKKKMKNMATL